MSIQVHPDKRTATILHAKFPDIYKGNAILFFKPLILKNSIRPQSQTRNGSGANPVSSFVRFQTSPWNRQVSKQHTGGPSSHTALRHRRLSHRIRFVQFYWITWESCPPISFHIFDESIIHNQLDILVKRYQSQATQNNDIAQLVLKLNEQFPGDIGIFCPFVLNYVCLDLGSSHCFGCWRATCLYLRW